MTENRREAGRQSFLSRDEYLRKLAGSGERLDIRLTNDYAFRKTFKDKTVMKGFLMALFNLGEEEIADLEIIDPFEDGESPEEKEGILDIKVKMSNGKRVNVELQNRYQGDWIERSLFYQCRMFVEGFRHGQPYSDLEPCIHVGILDFDCLKSPGFHHIISLRDEETNECYSGKFLFHVVELKKLNHATETERQQPLYRWARLIAAADWKTVCEEAAGNEYMEAAREIMAKMSQDERERYLYLRQEMAYTDEISRMRTARTEGREEGREEGKKEGRAEGREEGRAEGMNLKEVILIQKKIRKGKTLEQIADETEEEIEDIRVLYELAKENTDKSAEEILEIAGDLRHEC